MRHGVAGPGELGTSDRDRKLTAEGIRQVEAVSRKAAALLPAAPEIISSPYLRALESAGIAAKAWSLAGQAARSGALTPESSPEEAWEEIRAHSGSASLLLVGHEPLFSSLAAFLLNAPATAIEVGTGTMIAIEMAPSPHPRGVLKWMLTPRLAES